MENLIKGQKLKLSNLSVQVKILIEITKTIDVDISCFGVDDKNKLSDDRYFIFYNQLESPDGAIKKVLSNSISENIFNIDLKKLPSTISKLVFTAAIDGDSVMNQITSGYFILSDNFGFKFNGNDFKQEKAIILAELYRRDNVWRLSIVGQGFNGGLSALLNYFGGEEESNSFKEEKKVLLTKAEKVKKVVLEKAPRLLDLTKKASIILDKKKLNDVVAKVILVLDVSGSMSKQYTKGRIQRILDKVLPLALLFDDDGSLESWAFAEKAFQLEDASLDNINDYIEIVNGGWKKWYLGSAINNEPAVLEEIFLKHKFSKLPVYVIFISDGGVSKNKKIKDIIISAAYFPIFWQFIGVSGKNYGALEKLDEMQGRYVDNANFFALDDIDDISDESLYDRLMNEFPTWLKLVKKKQIL